MLTFLQVCKILDISTNQLMEWIDCSLIPTVHRENSYYFSEHEITKLLEINEMINTRKMSIQEVREILPIEQPKNLNLLEVVQYLESTNKTLAQMSKKNDEMKELILHFLAKS